MPTSRVDDATLIDLIRKLGVTGAATHVGLSARAVHMRRRRIEGDYGIEIVGGGQKGVPPRRLRSDELPTPITRVDYPARLSCEIEGGIVLVGSDAHYWPNVVTTAHRAFVKFCRDSKPSLVVKNGDALDFPSISHHPAASFTDWERRPRVVDEIETTKARLEEIKDAAGPQARRVWPLGNHDARFEARLAVAAQEYANVHGVHLKDHFPAWEPCWSIWINDDVVVKHRFKGGIYAARNNTLFAGKTLIAGHLHSQKVWPHTDYGGTRWGVDCGTLAEPFGPQFDYLEDNPRDWRSGFVVLTFHKSRLLQPQLVSVIGEGLVDYCGQIIAV